MWDGYYQLGDTEIINVARTEAYAERFGLGWFRPVFENKHLRTLLDDDPYETPALDGAPWYEARTPESGEFYGAYPLDVVGLVDSTAQSSMLESLGQGGVASLTRNASKAGAFSVLLLAGSQAGADFGFKWLSRVLQGAPGAVQTWGGLPLTCFSSEPQIGAWNALEDCAGRRADPSDDPDEVMQKIGRTLRHAQVGVGLVRTGAQIASDGASIWMASFTLSINDSFEYGRELPVLERWLDIDDANPWPFGTPPAGASVSGPDVLVDAPCPQSTYLPVYDPLCPGVTPPPPPAALAWGCFDPPETWNRYKAVIPASLVPTWNVALPVFRFAAVNEEVRNARIRIYTDPVNTGDMDPLRPCDFVSDFVVSFVPLGSTLVLDSAERIIYVESFTNGARVADALVFSTDGGPFVWPEFTGGVQHVVMLDLDPVEVAPYVDMALVERFG